MVDKKISELTEITIIDSSDVMPIVDISPVGETKKITYGNIEAGINHINILSVGSNSHSTIDSHIANNSIHGTLFGPTVSTDNAVSVFNGLVGSAIKNSTLIYSDGKLYEQGYATSYLKFNSGAIEIWAGGVKQVAWN